MFPTGAMNAPIALEARDYTSPAILLEYPVDTACYLLALAGIGGKSLCPECLGHEAVL